MMGERSTSSRWGYAEFARIPGDRNRNEVIAGDICASPRPSPLHQLAVIRVLTRLNGFVEEHELGEVLIGPIDVLFGDEDFIEPDAVFVRRERNGIISDRGIEAAPDLIVEVVSPATSHQDRVIKRERYAYFGVPEYWIVDYEAKQVEVYRMLQDPLRPIIYTDSFKWQPYPGGPALILSVPDITQGFSWTE
jgi:Uma2 family endonuclease